MDIRKKKAKEFQGRLRELAEKYGYNPERVRLRGPEKDARVIGQGEGTWRVVWEDGPFEWAIRLLGGDSMFGGMVPEAIGTGPEVEVPEGIHCETWRGFDVGFFKGVGLEHE